MRASVFSFFLSVWRQGWILQQRTCLNSSSMFLETCVIAWVIRLFERSKHKCGIFNIHFHTTLCGTRIFQSLRLGGLFSVIFFATASPKTLRSRKYVISNKRVSWLGEDGLIGVCEVFDLQCPAPAPRATASRGAAVHQTELSLMNTTLPSFGGLVLGYIEAEFCK